MILNGDEILQAHKDGRISIDPWDDAMVGTNSYNITLHDELMFYTTYYIDPKKDNPTKKVKIQEEGFTIWPGEFALGATAEIVDNSADDLVPMIEGRSSVARLGITIHGTAGFGDIGFSGRWTLEISCRQPIKLYAGMPIGQLYWIRTNSTNRRYRGKYQHLQVAGASRLFKEF